MLDPCHNHVLLDVLDDGPQNRLIPVQLDKPDVVGEHDLDLVDFSLLRVQQDGVGQLRELRILLQENNDVPQLLAVFVLVLEGLHLRRQVLHRVLHLGAERVPDIGVILDLVTLLEVLLDR